MKYDVFISYASEDKNEIARPLAESLVKRGLRVWYDEFELKAGDRIRNAINQGIKDSRYGVIILSRHFFVKKWPREELDALAQIEGYSKIVILPLWHNVGVEDIKQFSPMLADRVGISTLEGIKKVANEICRVLLPEKQLRESFVFIPPGKFHRDITEHCRSANSKKKR